jgi:hypothetical protein
MEGGLRIHPYFAKNPPPTRLSKLNHRPPNLALFHPLFSNSQIVLKGSSSIKELFKVSGHN